MNQTDINEIILQAYTAAQEPEKWSDVLDRLTEQLRGNGAILWEFSGQGENRRLTAPYFSSTYRQEALEEYVNRYNILEVGDQLRFEAKSLAFGRAAPDKIELVNEYDLYSNEEEYLSQPHVKEMLRFGIRHRYGALLDRDNPFHARFSLQTGEERGELDAKERAALGTILPHFAKALELTSALYRQKKQHSVFLEVLNSFDVGICILDQDRRVIEKNTEFDRQIDEFGAFWISPDSSLVLHDKANREHFDLMLADFRNHGIFGARPRKEAIIVDTQDKAAALCLELLPPNKIAALGTRNDQYAVLLSRDTTREVAIDLHNAKLAFHLTDAELKVVDMVCRGLTNPEIAEERKRSVETINAQVKNILSKTGTTNRTQLVRLMFNFPLFA